MNQHKIKMLSIKYWQYFCYIWWLFNDHLLDFNLKVYIYEFIHPIIHNAKFVPKLKCYKSENYIFFILSL